MCARVVEAARKANKEVDIEFVQELIVWSQTVKRVYFVKAAAQFMLCGDCWLRLP